MYVFRVRDYKTADNNPNVPPMKLEATTEHRAASFADQETDKDWIYFFVDLNNPEDL